MKPYLKKTKWVPHNSGFMPFFSTGLNKYFFKPLLRIYFKITDGNNNTMTDWDIIFGKKNNIKLAKNYLKMIDKNCENLFKSKSLKYSEILDKFTNIQKRNLFHIGNFFSEKNK